MSKGGQSSQVVWGALAALGGAATVGLCVAACTTCSSRDEEAPRKKDNSNQDNSNQDNSNQEKKGKRKRRKDKKRKQEDNGPLEPIVAKPQLVADEVPRIAEETWEAASAYEAARCIVKGTGGGEERYAALGDPYSDEQDAQELARRGQAELEEDDQVDMEAEDMARKAEVPEIVARLSVEGALKVVPEQRADEELAVLMGVRVERLRLDFNAYVQQLLDQPAPTPHEQRERGDTLGQLVRVYNDVAQRVGRFVVEMVRQEPCTWVLKPLGKGLAGGVKFIVGKLLVKVPLAAGRAAQLFNGDQLLLHKAGGCELRALNALMEHNVPGVHAPLDVAVEVCGLEAHVMALLPIDGEESLKVGSSDAAETLQCPAGGVAVDAAHKVAVALHLKPHRVCEGSTGEVKVMPLAGDVEVHESAEDGRAYLLDVGRLLPPTSPYVDGVPLPLVHQFRPEFMEKLPVELPSGQVVRALSPDGFCGWGRLDFEEHHAELRAVWQVVLRRSVGVARRVVGGVSEEGQLAALLWPAEAGGKRALAQAFHAEGVNMRTLLVARAGLSVGEHMVGRQVLLLECAFRAVKHMVRRRLLQVVTMESEDVHAVMCALEEELEKEATWRGEVCRTVERLFVSHVQQVPDVVCEQFVVDKCALADDLVEVLALVRDEASVLGQAFVASVRGGVPGVRRVEGGRWEAAASVTQVRLPPYGDVEAAVRRLEVEIEVRKQTKGDQSMGVLEMQAAMLEVLENFVEEDVAITRTKAEGLIAEIEASVGEDPERMFALVRAGIFWHHVGELDMAVKILDRVRRVYEGAHGPDHEDLVMALGNMANVYNTQGAYDKALELYERALAINQAIHGLDHPSVAQTLQNMAGVYQQQGAYDKALELYGRALAGMQATLGPGHPSVGVVLNGMAAVHQAQGAYDKALELFERALTVRQAALGPSHPSVGQTLTGMAAVYQAQGAYGKALELYDGALSIVQAALGPNHPSVGDTLNNMAMVYGEQGVYDKALKLYERALATRQVALGREHPYVAQTLNNMAAVHEAQGAYDKALELYERALRIVEAALGPEHPSVGDTLNNMAGAYDAQGEYSKALELYERALSIAQTALGPNHPSVAMVLNNVAIVYKTQGEYGKALELFERALAVTQAALGPNHSSVAQTLNGMAGVYQMQGELRKAVELYERALAIMQAALGPGHPNVAQTMANMVDPLIGTGKALQAKTYAGRAVAIFRASLPAGHPYIAFAEQALLRADTAVAQADSTCSLM